MHDISLILLITCGLSFALIFGTLSNRLGLSPIVGYLIAGIAVGPHTPGFVADPNIASQLAEMGVILLMFGVGLHFHTEDLLRVRRIAIPGAVVQITAAILLSLLVASLCGLAFKQGLILGVAVSVASTVVLIRVLMDNNVLHTTQGHIAVGWLIVEDLFTVMVLVLLPTLKLAMEAGDHSNLWFSVGTTFLKIAALVAIVLILGKKVLPKLLNSLARTRSRELFTLGVLVIALGIATGSAVLFDVSMALGAFLAGMVVGQSDVSHQAASDALPMRDAFAVLFFVSVGMLFDPGILLQEWPLILGLLAVILIGKPLAALVLVLMLGYSVRAGLTVAIALAQIGEFSFILGEVARSLDFLDSKATGVLVTCAIASISLNSILFRMIPRMEHWLLSIPFVAAYVTKRLDSKPEESNLNQLEAPPRAVVAGYGPVGKTLTRILRDFAIPYTILDLNVDTIRRLRAKGENAVYGDASSREILIAAGIEHAEYLFVTLPDDDARYAIIETARAIRPNLKILLRARYQNEVSRLGNSGALAVAYEEIEVAIALAKVLLREIGIDDSEVSARSSAIREQLLAPS